MQEASGADFTDRNWSAQLPAPDPHTDHRLHSAPAPSFTSPDADLPAVQWLRAVVCGPLSARAQQQMRCIALARI